MHLSWLGCMALSTLSAPSFADQAAPSPAERAVPQLSEEVERQAESISRSVMSPFCPGRTVSSCPNAGPWRDDIRKWVGEGVPADEIRRRLHERVPEHNLMGVPPNRLGWALPVGAALLALGALVLVFRYLLKPSKAAAQRASTNGAQSQSAEAAAPTAQQNADLDARLEEELETLDDDRR